jgi:hypothetical protein
MAKKTSKARKTPWDRSNPRKKAGKPSRHLTPAQKRSAKASAKRAGRPYPNLVDNMRVAAASKKRSAKKARGKTTASNKTPAKKSGAKKSVAKKTVARKTAGKKTGAKKTAAKNAAASRT